MGGVHFGLMALAATALAGAAFPQAMAEHALASGAAAAAAGSVQKLGKQTAAALEKAGANLKTQPSGPKSSGAAQANAPRPRPSATPTPSQKQPSPEKAAASPVAQYEDPTGIQAGMQEEELLRRFGEPVFSVTGETGRILMYEAAGHSLQVEMRGGKVARVNPPRP